MKELGVGVLRETSLKDVYDESHDFSGASVERSHMSSGDLFQGATSAKHSWFDAEHCKHPTTADASACQQESMGTSHHCSIYTMCRDSLPESKSGYANAHCHATSCTEKLAAAKHS